MMMDEQQACMVCGMKKQACMCICVRMYENEDFKWCEHKQTAANHHTQEKAVCLSFSAFLKMESHKTNKTKNENSRVVWLLLLSLVHNSHVNFAAFSYVTRSVDFRSKMLLPKWRGLEQIPYNSIKQTHTYIYKFSLSPTPRLAETAPVSLNSVATSSHTYTN